MKDILFLFSLLFSIILCSCSERNNVVVNETFLNGQEIKIDKANNDKWPKFLFGDVLYAWKKDYYGGKLTKEEWHKADSLLSVGHGHNEFEFMTIAKNKENDLFVLNYPMVGSKIISLTKIPHADSIAAIKDKTKWERYGLGQLPSFCSSGNNFVVLSDSTILVAGTPSEDFGHIFSIIDYKNQKVVPLNYWPNDGVKCDSLPKHRMYAEHCILLGNENGKFLYKNEYCKLACIFSINKNKINILKSIYSEMVDYGSDRSKKDFDIYTPSTERLACCVDSNRICLLIRDSDSKGEKLKNFKNPFIFGNTVEIYDWDGIKQHVIHLDKYGQDIMLANDGNTLYLFPGYSEETTDPIIYSYDLRNIK